MAKGQFKSGAKRSEIKPAYHLIPPEALERLAKRYAEGGEKYGLLNWYQGINDPEYVRQIIDHIHDHLQAFNNNGCKDDDNLAAIMWGCAALMVIEAYNPTILTNSIFGERWNAIYNAVTQVRTKQNLYKGQPE
jgi:hypothetical protein